MQLSVPSRDQDPVPSNMLPNGRVESTLDGLPRLGDCDQSVGIHKVNQEVENRSRDGIAVDIRKEGE